MEGCGEVDGERREVCRVVWRRAVGKWRFVGLYRGGR